MVGTFQRTNLVVCTELQEQFRVLPLGRRWVGQVRQEPEPGGLGTGLLGLGQLVCPLHSSEPFLASRAGSGARSPGRCRPTRPAP